MALRINDTTAIIKRLTNLVPASSNYCCCFWIKLGFTATAPNYIAPLAITDAAYNAWTGVFSNASLSDNSHHINVSDGGAPVTTIDKILTSGRQYHIGYRRDGTTHNFFVDGNFIGSVVKDISAISFFEMLLGNDRFSVVNGPIDIWEFKEWNNSKTGTVIQLEMQSFGAVASPFALVTYTPLNNNLDDISGNNNHWIGSGNFSFVSNPGHPVNVTPATASNLTFNLTPTTTIQRVDEEGHVFRVFYKYVNNSGKDQVVSLGHWGDGLASYKADCFIYGDIDKLIQVADNYPNGSTSIPIPNGQTYWFEFFPNPSIESATPINLNIKSIRGPENLAQTGDVFIRSASFGGGTGIALILKGLHGGFIRSGSGIIGYVPQFPAGESGDIIPSTGRMVFADEAKSWETSPGLGFYYIYVVDPSFNILHKITWESPQLPPGVNRTHLPTNKVYFVGYLSGSVRKYSTIDGNGIQGPVVTFPFTGTIRAIAVNNAETKMYISRTGGNISQLDIASNTEDSDLAPAVADYMVTDILNIDDDTKIAMYYKSSSVRDFFIRRYNSAGVILNTYVLPYAPGLGSTHPRLGYSAQLDAFWVLHHLTSDYNVSTKVKIDGTILSTTTTPNVLQSDNEQANPPIPYTSDSCPIIELRANQTGSGGTIIIIKTTDPTTVNQEFNISIDGGLIPSSFLLKNGESRIYENVPPGVYSIVEALVSGFSIAYSVSDGSPNTSINVAAGETVTIVIVNTLLQKVMSGIYKIVPGKRQDTLWLENFTGTRDVKIP